MARPAHVPTERATSLPVRDIGDLAIADVVAGPGCPLCRLRADASRRYLEAILWEQVNDPGLRETLARGGGFCRDHAQGLAAADRAVTGGVSGAAILYEVQLRLRDRALRAVLGGRRSRAARKLATASAPPSCPACAQVAGTEARAVDRLLGVLEDESWAEALARAEWCLDDLLRIWQEAVHGDEASYRRWLVIAERQLERIEAVRANLAGFAHHSSYDRRHLMDDAELAATERARLILGGDPVGRARSR